MLSADLPDAFVTTSLPCTALELQAVPGTDQWRWFACVEHSREFHPADWDMLSLVDSAGLP